MLGMMALLPLFSAASVPAHASSRGLACSLTPSFSQAQHRALAASSVLAPPEDPLREEARASELLLHWAPSFAREVSAAHPERDQPLPIDFDGDWDATNNWSDLSPQLQRVRPVVYGSAILTSTHAYLFFTLFYPRDWASPVCISYLCHDNDLEVALLVVRRASPPEVDELVFVETKAHREYVALRASEIATDALGRPWIRVESEGHGMYPMRTSEPLTDTAQRLVPPRAADAAEARDTTSRSYELARLHDTLWARRDPASARSTLWTSGDTGFLSYAGARLGRRGHSLGVSMAGREFKGGVRPPWGLKGLAGERGDWFLDPAYIARLQYPDWFGSKSASLEYVFHPFLDDLTRECVDLRCPAILPPPFPSRTRLGVVAGLALATGLVSLRARRRVLARCRRWLRHWRAR
jgi:hypothetical protein